MQTIGVILAGGGGQRLGGVRKGELRLGGIPLAIQAYRRLAPQCDTVLLSLAAGTLKASPQGMIALPDDPAGPSGPAAGLYAAARWCATNAPGARLLSMAVDTPFFPSDFISRAGESSSPCIVGTYGDRDYPTNALWQSGPLLAVLETIPAAPRGPRLRDIQREMSATILDYTHASAENPFAGINTLADLLALNRRLPEKSDVI